MKGRAFMSQAVLALSIVLSPLVVGAKTEDSVAGQVTKVDEGAGKITIKHGPIKKFDMDDGMTMVFCAGDTAMMKAVKAGDNVRFVADRINGQFTITKSKRRNSRSCRWIKKFGDKRRKPYNAENNNLQCACNDDDCARHACECPAVRGKQRLHGRNEQDAG